MDAEGWQSRLRSRDHIGRRQQVVLRRGGGGGASLPLASNRTTAGNVQQMRSQEVLGRPRVHASDAERQRSRRQRESSQERAVRLHADRLRHQRGRARETSQERVTRHQEDSERHRELRARETSQERATRHQEDSERHRQLRERETSQERAAGHQEDSERHRQLRERETSQERAARHQEDAHRHRRSRTDEDPEERRVRLTTDAERHRRRRSLPSRMLGITLGGRVAAQDLWNDFADAMSDDYIHQGYNRELAIAFAYFDVLDRMALIGKNLEEMVSPPVAERPVAPSVA
ncbi:hypothetical protein GCK32_019801, partial [Trichostrongylus colubriformis]